MSKIKNKKTGMWEEKKIKKSNNNKCDMILKGKYPRLVNVADLVSEAAECERRKKYGLKKTERRETDRERERERERETGGG